MSGEDRRVIRPSVILEEAQLFARIFLPEEQDPDQPLDSSVCINPYEELEEMYQECSMLSSKQGYSKIRCTMAKK